MGQGPSKPDEPSSSNTPHQSPFCDMEEGQAAPPYESIYDDQPQWNVCDAPACTCDDKNQDATFPREPFVFGGAIPDVKPKNVILFGETGVGKSSVINLMAGAEVAKTSSNLEGCTMQATEYSFVLSGKTPCRIYDTVGLNEPEMGVNTFFGAVKKAHELISSLHNAGGIDLLLFCIRGNRITATVQRNYRLFYEFLGDKKIPVALVVTHLELEDTMEDWWERNKRTFEEYEITSIAHACITAAPARVVMYSRKREQSRFALERMLHKALGNPNSSYKKDVTGWFTRVVEFLWSIFTSSFKKENLMKELQTRCGLSRSEAQKLADMLASRG